jgi:hypothetical protein
MHVAFKAVQVTQTSRCRSSPVTLSSTLTGSFSSAGIAAVSLMHRGHRSERRPPATVNSVMFSQLSRISLSGFAV